MPLTGPERCDLQIPLGRGTPKSHSSGWLGKRWDTQAICVLSLECFIPHRSKLGYAARRHPQQTNTVLILLISPDIFSASTTWACNRKIFIAQRIRWRRRPAFCCKYCAEGYVVFTFLNANKKWKCYSLNERVHVASCPSSVTARACDINTCWTFACSRSPSFFTSSQNRGLSLGLLCQQSSMIW